MKHTFTARSVWLTPLKELDAAALRNVQVVVFHKWDTTREPIESASPDDGVFVTRGAKMQSWNRMDRDCLFYFENLFVALDSPGEWFLDPQGWVYYWPRPGEDMKRPK